MKPIVRYTIVAVALACVYGAQAAPPRMAFPSPREQRVRVGILSKSLRLLKGGTIDTIVFFLPHDARIENRAAGAWIEAGKIEVAMRGGEYVISADNREFTGNVDLLVRAPGRGAECRVVLPGETRRYPLPCEITGNGGDIRIVVSDGIGAYARDSARAEYGPQASACAEAVEALALVIAARCENAPGGPSHNGFDFCDLTHCQVYRGRTGDAGAEGISFPWMIKPCATGRELLFHSCCGGRTFGPDIFGGASSAGYGVKDWLSSQGVWLCNGAQSKWQRSISLSELAGLVMDGHVPHNAEPASLVRDMRAGAVVFMSGREKCRWAPEEFRLKINRVRGWNFIKSNNYDIVAYRDSGETIFRITGSGLGHGVGLCQQGALSLARLGYSRYEIIEHYYPGICFRPEASHSDCPPGVSYVIFSQFDGSVERASHAAIVARRIPPGSLFKLIVSMYCASRRPDIAGGYRYRCWDGAADAAIPERCWKPRGHGEMDLSSALSKSCNRYFASLYSRIDRRDFAEFYASLCAGLGIDAPLPSVRDDREFARLLAGLDYRVRFTVRDMMALCRVLAPGEAGEPRIERTRERIPVRFRAQMLHALYATFQNGTASHIAADSLREPGTALADADDVVRGGAPIWGKTATVLDGTNVACGYGYFLGGDTRRGIVVIMRNGIGAAAAGWARILMSRNEGASETNQ